MAVHGFQILEEADVPKLVELVGTDGLIEHLRLDQPDVFQACRDAGDARAGEAEFRCGGKFKYNVLVPGLPGIVENIGDFNPLVREMVYDIRIVVKNPEVRRGGL